MRKLSLLMVVVLSILMIGAAEVQAQGSKSDVDLYVGMLKFGGVGEADGSSEIVFGARYGHNMNANSTIELNFGLIIPENAKILQYHINYLYNVILSGNEQITPFFTGGVGAITIMVDDVDTDTGMSINVGGGVKYAASGPWGIRVDVRDHIDWWDVITYDPTTFEQTTESEMRNSIEFSGGVTYAFY
jgi:hypothetical protein